MKRDRKWHLAALVLGLAWLSIGCSPATLSFFFMPFTDTNIPPRCKLAAKGKEVTVCIVSNFASLETRGEIVPSDGELAALVAQQLRKRTQENKEKVIVVDPSRTRNQALSGRTLQEIGTQFKADYVVALEIQNLTLYEKGTTMLYRGNIDMVVRVVDVKQGEGAAIFNEPLRCEYPGMRGPIDTAEMNVMQFRSRFLNKVAGDVARLFTGYPPEQRLDME
jgi:hypothetical protein